MAQIKISALPLYTGNTTGVYLVMNNSGQTTTYKVTKETLIGSSGTSGTSGSNGSSGSSGTSGSNGTNGSSGTSGSSGSNGSSGTSGSNGTNGSSGTSGSNGTNGSSGTSGAVGATGSSGTSGSNGTNGSSGTSGINGTSGTSGDSIFALTGSVWNTTRNFGITGSLNVSGSLYLTGSVLGRVLPLTITSTTASLNLDSATIFTLQLIPGTITHILPTNVRAGETINLLISTTGSAQVTFPSTVKQPSGSSYIPTTTTGKDILSMATFDNTNVYLTSIKNLI